MKKSLTPIKKLGLGFIVSSLLFLIAFSTITIPSGVIINYAGIIFASQTSVRIIFVCGLVLGTFFLLLPTGKKVR